MPSTAVHGRADLVAHIGQELALGSAGLLRPVFGLGELGVHPSQLGGAGQHLLLQALSLALQFAVATLDVRQHIVEAIDQRPQLVVARLVGADSVVLQPGYGPGRLRQVNHGVRYDPLQPCRDQEGGPSGQQHHRQQNRNRAAQPLVHRPQVQFDPDPSEVLALQVNPAGHDQPAVPEDAPVFRGRLLGFLLAAPAEGGKRTSGSRVDLGRLHRRLGVEPAQQLIGRSDIFERQCGRAILDHHSRQNLRLAPHRAPCRSDVVSHQRGTSQQQGRCHREHNYGLEFFLEAQAAYHCDPTAAPARTTDARLRSLELSCRFDRAAASRLI